MAISAMIVALVAFLVQLAIAIPNGNVIERQAPAPPSPSGAQLAMGIGWNIMAQTGEAAAISDLQSIGAAPTPDAQLFGAAKDDLLAFMSCGMRIRSNNMKLSGIDPQIERGLGQLQARQVLQMATANNLTGAAGDSPLLERLQSQVQADIQRNSMLQAMATGGKAPDMMTYAAMPTDAPTG